MKFVMIAELLLILFSNGIRFYAVKRYIDFFAAREKCLWKYNWILYTFACIGTYIVSIIFESLQILLERYAYSEISGTSILI